LPGFARAFAIRSFTSFSGESPLTIGMFGASESSVSGCSASLAYGAAGRGLEVDQGWMVAPRVDAAQWPQAGLR
jgi:hypothetical protein